MPIAECRLTVSNNAFIISFEQLVQASGPDRVCNRFLAFQSAANREVTMKINASDQPQPFYYQLDAHACTVFPLHLSASKLATLTCSIQDPMDADEVWLGILSEQEAQAFAVQEDATATLSLSAGPVVETRPVALAIAEDADAAPVITVDASAAPSAIGRMETIPEGEELPELEDPADTADPADPAVPVPRTLQAEHAEETKQGAQEEEEEDESEEDEDPVVAATTTTAADEDGRSCALEPESEMGQSRVQVTMNSSAGGSGSGMHLGASPCTAGLLGATLAAVGLAVIATLLGCPHFGFWF